jgi:nitrogenase molybdenum-iron protein alpha/beta subunit
MSFIVVVPHTPLHDIRTPLYRQFGDKISDIVIIYPKTILDTLEDYENLKTQAEQMLPFLNGKKVALLLTGSYAAVCIIYKFLLDHGFDVILLQYDAHRKRYLVIT